ncbi:MAG TPA: DUF6754 domain-containing protein [Anaerolineae bacterium]|nr:DUF6754 domain-containing protein [Anaerolineae bacterium]
MAQQLVQIGLIVVVLVLPIASWVFSLAIRRGRVPQLRPLPALDIVQGQLGRGIETGHPAHISIGAGGIAGEDTLVTLAGASIVDSVAQEAADTGAPPTVTVADGTALILAQDMLRRPHTRRGDISGYDPLDVQLLGVTPFQYAAGALEFIGHAHPVSNVMIGSFGPEVGLIAEQGVREGLTQVGGSVDARALAVLHPSVDHLLIGEDVFAAPAYLDQRPSHLGRLQAQDLTRFVLVGVILLAVILQALETLLR